MKPVTIIIVEDSEVFADALKKTLESQNKFPCKVVVLDPNLSENPPSFEQFHDQIQELYHDGFANVVLMDNQLGKWRWKGGHLAPSFTRMISISTDTVNWAKYSFTGKTAIAYHDKDDARDELINTIMTVFRETMPEEFWRKLFPSEPTPTS
jgi:hypothetical protein